MSILNNAGHDPAQQPPPSRSPMRTALEIRHAISSFNGDPADTDYQRGYLDALKWVAGQERPDKVS